MDDLVRAALRKWPNVPACRGWLALDARGDWYMRDERVQAAGPFPAVKGSRIEHATLRAFIERNYLAGPDGRWFFQNGPQKVEVELEAAPYVWRLETATTGALTTSDAPAVHSHTGLSAEVKTSWLDERGRLFLDTDLGFGLVHTLDMDRAADAVEAGCWTPETLPFAEMPARFGYCLSPAARGA